MGYHDKNVIDEERFVAMLKDAVSKVKTEEDPLVLNQYKKLFKKNVPFSLRMYVSAYLAKNASYGFRYRREHRRDKFRSNEIPSRSFAASEEGEERARHRTVIDEALAATIFLSVGRNRRVFPRDLIHLVVQSGGIERERIGDIRVLDNYSFVQLFAEDADKVIAALNGVSYRGRPLQASYSRKKEDLPQDDGVALDSKEALEAIDKTYESSEQ